jgi:hypothetical protein
MMHKKWKSFFFQLKIKGQHMPKYRATLALIYDKVSLAIHKYSSAQKEIIK